MSINFAGQKMIDKGIPMMETGINKKTTVATGTSKEDIRIVELAMEDATGFVLIVINQVTSITSVGKSKRVQDQIERI